MNFCKILFITKICWKFRLVADWQVSALEDPKYITWCPCNPIWMEKGFRLRLNHNRSRVRIFSPPKIMPFARKWQTQFSNKGRLWKWNVLWQSLIWKCCHKNARHWYWMLELNAGHKFNFCSLRIPGVCVAIFNVPSVALQKFCVWNRKIIFLQVGVST
jgi:hypothetical protein